MSYLLVSGLPQGKILIGMREQKIKSYWLGTPNRSVFRAYTYNLGPYYVVHLLAEDDSVVAWIEVFEPRGSVVLIYDPEEETFRRDESPGALELVELAKWGGITKVLSHKWIGVWAGKTYWDVDCHYISGPVAHSPIPSPIQPEGGETEFEALWRQLGEDEWNVHETLETLAIQFNVFKSQLAGQRFRELIWICLRGGEAAVRIAPYFYLRRSLFFKISLLDETFTDTKEKEAEHKKWHHRLMVAYYQVGKELGILELMDKGRYMLGQVSLGIREEVWGINSEPKRFKASEGKPGWRGLDYGKDCTLYLEGACISGLRLDGRALTQSEGCGGIRNVPQGYHEIEIVSLEEKGEHRAWFYQPGKGRDLKLSWGDGLPKLRSCERAQDPELAGHWVNARENEEEAQAWRHLCWALKVAPEMVAWIEPPKLEEGEAAFDAWWRLLRGQPRLAIAQVQSQALLVVRSRSRLAEGRLWKLIKLHTFFAFTKRPSPLTDYMTWYLLCMDGLLALVEPSLCQRYAIKEALLPLTTWCEVPKPSRFGGSHELPQRVCAAGIPLLQRLRSF